MQPSQFMIEVPRTGRQVEVWRKGGGRDLVFLHGPWGLPAWTPDLEALAQNYRVTVPFFPGFARSDGEDGIYDVLDAVLHMYDVLEALRIQRPLLAGHSFGGMIAAEMAAVCPREIDRLILISPFGLWEEDHPGLDLFTYPPYELAKHVFFDPKHPAAVAMSVEPDPEDEGLVDMYVDLIRGLSSAGRLMWPIAERGLASRLDRIIAPTMIAWGEADELNPFHYARLFQKAIAGSKLRTFKNASHLLTVEQGKPLAAAIHQFIKGEATTPPRPRKEPVRVTLSALKNAARRAHSKVLAARAEGQEPAATARRPEPQKPEESNPAAKKAAATKKPSGKKSPPKKSSPKKASSRKPVSGKTAAKKAAPKKPVPKKPAKKKAANKKAVPKKAAGKAKLKKAAPKKPAAGRRPPKKAAAGKGAPKKSAVRKKPAGGKSSAASKRTAARKKSRR